VTDDDLQYIEAEIQGQDRDRYLTSLFAPAALRPRLWALYAFNIELARVRETVSEPMMGEIRLQWWRDAVTAMAGGGAVPHQPVAQAVANLVRDGLLSPESLIGLIDARLPEIYDETPADLAALEARIGAVHGTLARLAAVLLGATEEEGRKAADAGTAWGLSHVLKESSRRAAANRIELPQERMAVLGITPAVLMKAGGSDEQRMLLGEVAERLKARLAAVQGRHRKAVRSASLVAALARSDLKAMEAARFDPSFDLAARPAPGRLARLYWAGLTGRI
jgi:phytoene synthase